MQGFNDAILEPTRTELWSDVPNQANTVLHPDQIDVWRLVEGAVGLTGNKTKTPTKIITALPCYLSHAMTGSEPLMFPAQSGEMVPETDSTVIDGLNATQCAEINPEYAPGDTLVLNGISYKVAYNARGAFPDVQPFDVVVCGGNSYLVLFARGYYDLLPTLQLHLAFGRAPADIPPPS